jgi:hypothetical protein
MTIERTFNPRTREFLEKWPLFDSAIIAHGFAPFMRDYEVIVDAGAAAPDGSGSYIEGRYRLRFTHCVRALTATTVGADIWRRSWGAAFADYAEWQLAGEPDGYVWGVEYMNAYPGGKLIDDSIIAADWTSRLSIAMHEAVIETNCHTISLVFHQLTVHRIGRGDPKTRAIEEVPAEDLMRGD